MCDSAIDDNAKMNQCEFVDEHEESPVVLKNAFAEEDRTSLQAFDDGGEDDCASCMNIILSTSSEDLTLRPTRSILKKSKETSSCEVKARSSRSKSVTFSMPDETPPRKRKERNPIRKVFEVFDRKCSSVDLSTTATSSMSAPHKLRLNFADRKSDGKFGESSSKTESNLPHWITYLQLNQRKRINQMERPKRSDLKQSSESGRFFTYRSHSLNSPSKGGAPFSVTQYKHYDHPFWISSYGEDLSRRKTYRQFTSNSPSPQKLNDLSAVRSCYGNRYDFSRSTLNNVNNNANNNENNHISIASNNNNNSPLASLKALTYDSPFSRRSQPSWRSSKTLTCYAPTL